MFEIFSSLQKSMMQMKTILHMQMEPLSSPVDWCEANYLVSPNIAEFVNTFSNVLFLSGPPLLIYLFKEYAKFVNPMIHLVWSLLIIVGLSSAYFHATLSLAGQLLDELAILWVFMATFAMFVPKRYLPKVFSNRRRFCTFMFVFTIAATITSVFYPAANAFALMTLTIPTIYLLYHELNRIKSKDMRVYRLGRRTTIILLIAVFCWFNDRFFCGFYTSIKFPYLHGFWHILIFVSSYAICVLFAYFFVFDEKPEVGPVLKYWPKNDFELGVPYIKIKSQMGFKDLKM